MNNVCINKNKFDVMVIGSFVVEVCILNVITDDVIINTDDVIRNVKW